MVKKQTSSKASKSRPPPPAQKKQYAKTQGSGSRPGTTSEAPRTSKPSKPNSNFSSPTGLLGVATQQLILNVFSNTFSSRLSSPDSFTAVLQEVKQALFERDFARAFGDEAYVEVYAARYSPTRALCYAEVLASVLAEVQTSGAPVGLLPPSSSAAADADATAMEQTVQTVQTRQAGHGGLRMVSIGGGAAELVGFAGCIRRLISAHEPSLGNNDDDDVGGCSSLTLIDSGPWKPVVKSLTTSLTTPPPLSKYASAGARASNTAFIDPPSRLGSVTYKQEDALSLSRDAVAKLFPAPPSELRDTQQQQQPLILITLFFTLNELFTAGGVGKTTAFLLALTEAAPPGALLLVVDSPGSYSETVVGKQAKRYPMHWLLDKVLLRQVPPPRAEQHDQKAPSEDEKEEGDEAEEKASGTNARKAWTKIEEHDSLWFRLSEKLSYPIPLEDMRYQMHLYRATTTTHDLGT